MRAIPTPPKFLFRSMICTIAFQILLLSPLVGVLAQADEASMPTPAPTASASPDEDFITTRVLNASRDLVYKAWTDPDRVMRWLAATGWTAVPGTSQDFKPGGTFHFGMKPDDKGADMAWSRWVFRELNPPDRIVYVDSFSNRDGGIERNPGCQSWPLETLSTITLQEQGKQTKLTLHWSPIGAGAEERKMFHSSFSGIKRGWNSALDQLETYLAHAQASK